MKRCLALLSMVLCLALVGCGGAPPKPPEPTPSTTATVEPSAATEATGTAKMTTEKQKEPGETPAVAPTGDTKVTAKVKPSKLFKLLGGPAFEAGKNTIESATGANPLSAPAPE